MYQVSNGQTWGSAWIVPTKHVLRAFKVHLSKAARQICSYFIGFGVSKTLHLKRTMLPGK